MKKTRGLVGLNVFQPTSISSINSYIVRLVSYRTGECSIDMNLASMSNVTIFDRHWEWTAFDVLFITIYLHRIITSRLRTK